MMEISVKLVQLQLNQKSWVLLLIEYTSENSMAPLIFAVLATNDEKFAEKQSGKVTFTYFTGMSPRLLKMNV